MSQTDMFASGGPDDPEVRAALAKAYRLLGVRARSEKELATALSRADFSSAAVAEALATCRRQGFLDDADFARQFIQSRLANRPSGRDRLSLELRQKGVEEATIAAALDELLPKDETLALAERVAERLRRRLTALPAAQARQRLAGHLKRRGFDWETIQSTRLWRELAEPEP